MNLVDGSALVLVCGDIEPLVRMRRSSDSNHSIGHIHTTPSFGIMDVTEDNPAL